MFEFKTKKKDMLADMSFERLSDVPTSPVVAETSLEPRGSREARCRLRLPMISHCSAASVPHTVTVLLYLVFAFPAAKAKPRRASALALPDSALGLLPLMFCACGLMTG